MTRGDNWATLAHERFGGSSTKSKKEIIMHRKLLMLVAAMLVFGCLSWAKTITGTVSDAMCGAKHDGDPVACTKKCEDGGSKLVVVANGKVYNTDQQDKLKGHEGAAVKVTGTVKGDAITITDVADASAGK
jgi:hypothetical protein